MLLSSTSPVILSIMLNKVVLTFESVVETLSVTMQMKATEQPQSATVCHSLPRVISHHWQGKPICLVQLLNKTVNLHSTLYFNIHVLFLQIAVSIRGLWG